LKDTGTPPAVAPDPIRCRVAACLEDLGDGKEWSFYLLNDGGVALDAVVLKAFGHEWGDRGPTENLDVHFAGVVPGAQVLLWRDDDEEMRMWLKLAVRARGRDVELLAEFPMLYKRKRALPLLPALSKPGFVVPALAVSG
jgi:hypothetical protein